MSKKKSLGSSPIGYSSLGADSFEFIPTIEISSPSGKEEEAESVAGNGHNGHDSRNKYASLFTSSTKAEKTAEREKNKAEKKIVSYYLEEDLIERLKRVADEKKMYYSTLVSNAIYCWLEQNSC